MTKTLAEFIESLPNKNTKRVYQFALNKFFNFLSVNRDNYLDGGRNYETDTEKHLVNLSAKKKSPISIRTQLAAIKAYLFENEI